MAKNNSKKTEAAEPDADSVDESQDVQPDSKQAAAGSKPNGRFSPTTNRPKKAKSSANKSSTIMPSDEALENLRLAVSAAGDADKLLQVLQYVENAGGTTAVVESIEAYKALRTAVEQTKTSDPG